MSIDFGALCRKKEAMSTEALNNDMFAMSGTLVMSHPQWMLLFVLCAILPTPLSSHPSSARCNVSTLVCLQIGCFVICAIAQGIAYLRWLKWSAEEKRRGWRLYGWFTALSSLGSAAGALAYVARIGHLYGIYDTREQLANQTLTPQQAAQQAMSSRDMMRGAAAFHALFPLELGLVTTANLFVLHRMLHFSILGSQRQRAWRRCERLFLAAAVLCNAIGLSANMVSAVYFYQTGELFATGENLQQAKDKRQDAARIAAIQRFSEVVLLLMMIVAFSIVGANSYQVIFSALRALINAKERMRAQDAHSVVITGAAANVGRELIDQANTQGITLKRKILGSFAFIFCAIVARTSFTIMYALGAAGNNNSDKCSRSECNACKNIYSHILFWIVYTPVFQQTVLLIASPLGSLVALWGMSGVRTLEQVSDQLVQLDSMKN